MVASLPATYLEWESVLTRHFLAIGEGDASPLRSFEVTDLTLTEAVGLEHDAKEQVVEAFRLVLIAKERNLVEALQYGEYRRYAGDDIPGCFTYLALTLLVEGMIDPDASSHQFRRKLASFLKLDRSFSNLAGINLMWKELEKWLKPRVQNGLSFRALELPSEDRRKHIGYSVRMSFPSRKDKSVVQHFLDDNEGVLDSPLEFLTRFRRIADGSKTSVYLKSAYEDFRRSYLNKHRALADHRFWRLVQAINLGRRTSTPFELLIEMVRDEDDLWSFAVSDASTGRWLGSYGTLAQAVAACSAKEGHELMRAIKIGVIFFRQTGHARWEAMPVLADGLRHVMIGLSPDVADKVGSKLGPMERSGDWSLAQMVPAGIAQDTLGLLVKLPKPEEQIRSVSVSGGVRSAGEWLGRPSFLPKVTADASGLSITPRGGTNDGTITCEEELAGTYVIRSEAPLNGPYIVHPATDGDCTSPSWSRSLTFVRDAHVHQSLAVGKGANIPEWKDVTLMRERVTAPVEGWCDVDSKLDDLVEAVYAAGASGWNESKLIPMLSEFLAGDASSWDVLRSLQEATMLEPLLKPGWKGRTWTLRPPTIAPLTSSAAGLVVVDGYAGTRQIEDFRTAVEALGGMPFRSSGAAKWSPPLVGAIGVETTELAARLRWPTETVSVAGGASSSFVQTPISHEFYMDASFWSWKRRHFVKNRDDQGEVVSLTRCMNRSNRDHDVYVVSVRGQESRFVSRQAAIIHAHVARRTMMFEFEKGRIVRTSGEGALPIPIAAYLRYRNLRNSGTSGWRQYAYPARAADLAKLRAVLPGILKAETSQSAFELANICRRSGGSARFLWINESLVAARVSPPAG